MDINDYINADGSCNRTAYYNALAEYFEVSVDVVLKYSAKLGTAQDFAGLIDAIEVHVGEIGRAHV